MLLPKLASILPISLGYIAPLTRDFSSRVPDAVVGTDEPVKEATTARTDALQATRRRHNRVFGDLRWGFRKDSEGT